MVSVLTSNDPSLSGSFVQAEVVVVSVAIIVSVIIIFTHERVLYKALEPPRWLCLLTRTKFVKKKKNPAIERAAELKEAEGHATTDLTKLYAKLVEVRNTLQENEDVREIFFLSNFLIF